MTEEEATLKRIGENCEMLAVGYTERVEYIAPVKYANGDIVNEKRARNVNRPPLLDQLKEYAKNRDTNLNPKAARGAPRVKTPKLHPELNGFLTLDEITCDMYAFFDRILEEGGRDRAIAIYPAPTLIRNVHYQATQIHKSGRHDLVREIDKKLRGWVAKARAALNHTVSDAMFGDTVCGNCGGGLTVPWDNNGDVQCVGTPASPPCGETYPMSEWVRLYEESKRA